MATTLPSLDQTVATSMDGVGKDGEQQQAPSSWAVLKMRALLEAPIPAESTALLQAIRDVESFYSVNTPGSRRQLRRTLIGRAIESSNQVLDCFSEAHNELKAVGQHIDKMRDDVESLSDRLSGARSGASTVISQTSQLRMKLSESQHRASISKAFLNRFILQGDHAKSLEGEKVDQTFIEALQKLEQIHDDSRILLRCRNQRAGLEALEFAATRREEAYEKVFRFVQSQCTTLDVDAEEKESEAALLRQAIRALRARPMLLRLCAEEVGSARRASLVERFVQALTKGGPNGIPPPIELHAHDAMRYTNDMLAWIHQALASEKELMMRLFTLDENSMDYHHTREHNEQLALRVLNTIFDALCRPFRIRFEQALEQTLPVVVLYRLASLLEFYSSTMSQLLGPDAALPEMLMECNSLAMYAFFSAWKTKMESFRLAGIGPSTDLTPPAAVYQSMTRLDEIMATLEASLTPEVARQAQITAVLEVILNPLQSLCYSISKNLSNIEQHIFQANCIDCMLTPLVPYSFASPRVEQLTQLADRHIDEYISLSCVIVLRRCGLAERARVLSEFQSNADDENRKPLSKLAGMDVEALSISVKNFYAMLFGGTTIGSSEALQPPHVDKISNVRARNRAKVAVAESLAKTHTAIYEAVRDPFNEYGSDAVAVIGLRDAQKVELILTNGQVGFRY